MGGFRWTHTRVIAAVGALALAGSVALAGGIVSAQSPSPSPGQQQPPAGERGSRGEFTARLAQALGIPQERVENALRQLHEEKRERGDMPRARRDGLTQAAAQLGVTEQELREAMRAAMHLLGGQRQPGQGPRPRLERPDASAFLNAIAQQLGRGITGEQVRDALRAAAPAGGARPDPAQIQARAEERLQRLAALLGVSVDQLRAALQQIGGPMRGPRSP